MLPYRLKMTAFGPYAGTSVIDFRDLREKRFFLITGATGAGKSTILDALCFALYGDTSGGERAADEMRSDYAEPGLHTEVLLDFALGERQYRISRKPRQEIARQRGTGTRTLNPEATLWDRTECGPEDEGHVLATGVRDVGEQVVQLLGFQADQFRQVVVLPQGRFREVLSADSAKREEILKMLFRTDRFEALESELRERRLGLKQHVESLAEKQAGILEDLGVENEEKLGEHVKSLEENEKQSNDELKRLDKERSEAIEALNKGREGNRRLDEQKAAEERVRELEEQAPRTEEKKETLARAEKAHSLEPYSRNARKAREELAERAESLANAKRELERAEKALAAAREKEKEALAREPEAKRLQTEASRLESLKSQAESLGAAFEKRGEKQRQVNKTSGDYDKLKQACKRVEEELEKDRSRIEARRLQREGLEGLHAAAREKERVYTNRAQHARFEKELEEKSGRLEKCKAGEKGGEDRLKKAKDALRSLRRARDEARAAILAQSLESGHPCPVCGSTHHPAPADSGEELPGEEAIREQEELVEAREADLATLQEERRETESGITTLRERLRHLEDALGEQAGESLDALGVAREEALRKLHDAESAVKSLEKDEEDFQSKQKDLDQKKDRLDELDKILEKERQDLAALSGEVSTLEKNLPEELRETVAIETALARAEEQMSVIQSDMEKARSEREQAAQSAATWKSRLESAEKEARSAEEKAAREEEALRKQIEEAGFADQAGLEAARENIERMDVLKKQIKEFGENLKSARDRKKQAEENAKGLVRTNLEDLESAYRKIEDALGARREKIGEIKKELENLRKRIKEYEQVKASLEKERTRLEDVVAPVAEVAAGRKPNLKGVSLQRFVLGALLEDVLVAANARLRKMTRGRYMLLIQQDRQSGKKKAGLDLEVMDDYTGQARPVSTLSGGEGFMASLSLALGLSDVVTSHSGGVRLDTIFVDEGFGSLDAESLDLAVNTLIDLQKGGRLVGVISHVEEMRQQIDARLEITAGRSGSKAAFVVS